MNRPNRSASLAHSFRHAFAGLAQLLRTQRNARIHVGISILVFLSAAWLRVPLIEWALLAVCMGLVWAVEAVNTALEAIVDLVRPEAHAGAKLAKDLAAAAVLLSAIAAAAAGLLILGPPLLARIWPD